MRLGVVASSNGGAFRAVHEILENADVACASLVVTDRPCGIEAWCDESGIDHARIASGDNDELSAAAHRFFEDRGGVDFVLLFVTRLVTKALYAALPTFNIHPSLLPDYPGFGALRRAHADGATEFGATLHLVDERPDGGPIVAQVASPLDPSMGIETMRRWSFIHKVYLSLVLVELFRTGRIELGPANASVRVRDVAGATSLSSAALIDAFAAFQVREGVEALALRSPPPLAGGGRASLNFRAHSVGRFDCC